MLDKITPLILTWNEEVNIERVLAKLGWAKQVIVVDSMSTDATLEIVKKFDNAHVFQRPFDNHTAQWNYGLSLVKTEWVLSLDADYVLTDELIDEIKQALYGDIDGYKISFKYCIGGKPLRGSLLPPRVALFKKEKSIYVQDGHTQLLELSGVIGRLNHKIWHDDRKPIDRWLQAQMKYCKIELEKSEKISWVQKSFPDKIRSCFVLSPGLVFLYCLFIRGCIFEGWAGWFYSFQRLSAELIGVLYLLEKKVQNSSK